MISMSNVSDVGAAGSYYAEDNYYSEGENQARSAWEGRGAELLGLQGIVDTPAFVQILSGEIGGQELGRVTGKGEDGELVREHRPGFDVTLSAPKSVSILAEVGGFTDVRLAHEAATSKVLEYIEKNLVGARVTADGMTKFEQTDNVIAGRFHHTTSRALDPQTHTHLVIANATQTGDGVWRSLSNERLYKAQTMLGNIYDMELASSLRTLGYRLEMGEGGRWEVAGITREQIEHFSQRTKQINDRLEGFGLTRETATAAQREDAALRTREGKQQIDHAELRAHWQQRAQQVGIDFSKLEANREYNAERKIDPAFTQDKATEAVKFALAHLTERESVVSRDEVLTVAMSHALRDNIWAGVTSAAIHNALTEQIAHKHALEAPRDHITTAESLGREQRMLALLEEGRGAAPPVASKPEVDAAITGFEGAKSTAFQTDFRLTQGQVDAAVLALTSQDRFVGLQGFAGVGKTTMVELVNQVAVGAGYTVRGMASSGEAAMQLEKDSGIVSTTTARFLLDEGRRAAEGAAEAKPAPPTIIQLTGAIDLKGSEIRTLAIAVQAPKTSQAGQETAPARKELWVMDEGSLTGQREMTTFMDLAAKADAKVLILGDRLQLNAVEAGKPFELLLKGNIASAEMTEISRQRVDDLKQAVAHSVQRSNAAAFSKLESRMIEIENKGELLKRVALDVLAKHWGDRSNALVIAPLNQDRKAINDYVRDELQRRGEIGANQLERTILVKADLTSEQISHAAYYKTGFVIRFGSDSKRLGIERGEYGHVTGVDVNSRVVSLRMEDGRQLRWSPPRNARVEVYEKETRQIALGDEVRFTRSDKELGILNGTYGKVKDISPGSITLQGRNGAETTLDRTELKHGHLEYAHAMTVYSSQGKTVNDVSLLITAQSGRAMGERSFYVGITRERDDLTIYTDSKAKASELVIREQNKSSAIEALDGAASSGRWNGRGGRGGVEHADLER